VIHPASSVITQCGREPCWRASQLDLMRITAESEQDLIEIS